MIGRMIRAFGADDVATLTPAKFRKLRFLMIANIVIADIRATAIYEEALRALSASNVERRRLGWRFWWGNPFAGTTLLTASKAPA